MTDIPVASPKPSLWARLKSHILHPELSPNVVAWSFAIGFSIAWNPLLGLHTWMVILLCLIFRRLHRPLMFIAAFINNPWTMVPMATASVFLGNALLGRGWHVSLQGIRWHEIGWRSFVTREGFRATYQMIEPILAPYLLGGGSSQPAGHSGRLFRHAEVHGTPPQDAPAHAPRASSPQTPDKQD